MPDIENHLGAIRQKRGLSAIQLAAMVDVTRQTVYAIEAGSYVPNTAVALKLARALQVKLDDLFALPQEREAPPLRSETAFLLPGSDVPAPGQPVQLCRVEDRLMANSPSPVPWYFPVSDAVVAKRKSRKGFAQVDVFQSDGKFANRILAAGCDPGISVLARHIQTAGIELVFAHRNSSQALKLLESGHVHIAGTHMEGAPKAQGLVVISFAVWEEGIVTAALNPKGIRGIEDFSRGDISIVNREPGAGCRVLLDSRLKHLGIPSGKVRGYNKLAAGHLPAAWEVRSGNADACIATRSVARSFGLGFLTLTTERYDLVIRKKHLDLPGIQQLLDTLSRASFRRELEGLGGYDTSAAGQVQK